MYFVIFYLKWVNVFGTAVFRPLKVFSSNNWKMYLYIYKTAILYGLYYQILRYCHGAIVLDCTTREIGVNSQSLRRRENMWVLMFQMHLLSWQGKGISCLVNTTNINNRERVNTESAMSIYLASFQWPHFNMEEHSSTLLLDVVLNGQR